MSDSKPLEKGDSAVDAKFYRKTQRATRLTMAGQAAGQVVSLIVLAELYRLVDPVEFGVLGMFMPMVLLLRSFGNLGMDIATISKRDLTEAQASSLFWYQICSGGVLTTLLAVMAPILAHLYSTDRLIPLGLALSGTAFFYNTYSQHKSLIEKKLRFGRLVSIRLASLIISGIIAVIAAWLDFGVWALVIQQYAELTVLNIGYWSLEPWRPGKMATFKELRSLLNFSGFYTLSSVFFAIAQHLDKLALSLMLGGTDEGKAWIGFYTQAYNQMIRPVFLLTSPIQMAMLPSLSRAKHDKPAFARLTANFYRMITIMLAPCSIGMFLLGDRIMPLLGGVEWNEAGDLLAVMGLMILAQSWINISGSLMSAVGRTDILAVGAFCHLLSLTIAAAASFWLVGSGDPQALTRVLCVSLTVASVLLCGPYLAFCFHFAGVPPIKTMAPSLPAIGYAFLMGILVYGIEYYDREVLPISVDVVVHIVAGVFLYAVIARGEVSWLWNQFRGTDHTGGKHAASES